MIVAGLTVSFMLNNVPPVRAEDFNNKTSEQDSDGNLQGTNNSNSDNTIGKDSGWSKNK